jgi:hypothetical protein
MGLHMDLYGEEIYLPRKEGEGRIFIPKKGIKKL